MKIFSFLWYRPGDDDDVSGASDVDENDEGILKLLYGVYNLSISLFLYFNYLVSVTAGG